MLRRALPLLGMIPALAACAGATDAPSAGTVRFDRIGGVVYAINDGDGIWGSQDRWRVDTTRAVVIGVVDGEDEYVFGDVTGLTAGGDGRIYVADTQALEVRVFSPAGEFLERFGRRGEGPGEFRNISGIGRGPDGSIAVVDGQLGRVSVFAADGRFSRSFRLERPYMILERGGLVRFDARGRYHDRTTLSRGIGTDTIGVVRYSAGGQVEDTTVVAIHEPARILVRRNGVPVMGMPIPFAPVPSSTVAADGVIYATPGDAYDIAKLAPRGDTLLVIRRTVTPAAVSASERDAALEQIQERHREAVGTDARDVPALPQRKPAIAALRVDELGHLWVNRPSHRAETEMEWDVFDPGGRFLGSLTLPVMNIVHIGETTIAAIVRDEMDAPRVMLIPLSRGTTSS